MPEAPLRYSTDVLVVGGGLTGVCAAVAAAETGADVILIERNGRCGGNFTSSLVGTFCGYYSVENDEQRLICGGLGERVLNHLFREKSVGDFITYAKVPIIPFDVPVLIRFLDELLIKAKVRVLFHQFACDVAVENKRVSSVTVSEKTGQYVINCKTVIDCTGDGDVAFMAGVPTLADGGLPQFPSMIFHMGGVDFSKASQLTKQRLGELQKMAVESGEYDLPRMDGTLSLLPREGMVQANMGRIKIDGRPINALDPEELSYGQLEGRRQAFLYLDFVRKYVPGYENAYVCRLPDTVGIRETRRIKGDYVLTEEDFLAARKFPDGIACSSWPVEFHKEGSHTEWVYLPDGEHVEIPLRCLITQEVGNLFFAGRCLSADQTAHAAVRCGPPCMSMGEAVGICASMLAKSGGKTGDLDGAHIRELLRERGAHALNS